MSATATLKAAHAAGIRLGIDGDALVLEASAPPSPALLDLLARHKADILELLRRPSVAEDWRAYVTRGLPPRAHPGERAEAIAYEGRLVEWLNANPASSAPDRCAECMGAETPSNVLKPYGTTTSVWLHGDCWPLWRDKRLEQARGALAELGIMEDPYAGPPPKVIPWAREAPKEADDAPPF
jgi:hypothetical protein